MVNSPGPIPRGDLVPSGIVGLLGTQGPTSRTAIARALGLSPATVTQVTKDLIARGLVEELESVPSRGGRPSRLLGLVTDAGVALGAKVTADHVAVVTVELDGTDSSSSTRPRAIRSLVTWVTVAGLRPRARAISVREVGPWVPSNPTIPDGTSSPRGIGPGELTTSTLLEDLLRH